MPRLNGDVFSHLRTGSDGDLMTRAEATPTGRSRVGGMSSRDALVRPVEGRLDGCDGARVIRGQMEDVRCVIHSRRRSLRVTYVIRLISHLYVFDRLCCPHTISGFSYCTVRYLFPENRPYFSLLSCTRGSDVAEGPRDAPYHTEI